MFVICQILASVLFAYFALSTVYIFTLALAGRLNNSPVIPKSRKKRNAIILIPAYKEDSIIVHTARSVCAHNYHGGDTKVVIIADRLTPQTLAELRQLRLELLEVKFDKSSKARALHAALSATHVPGDAFVFILDADNVMGKGCLDKVNDALDAGFKAIQVHRTAKNTQTTVALLDAISEEINLNIFRRGAYKLGASAAPMGSGMAFLPEIFQELFSGGEILESVAEDRHIENYLLMKGIRLAFIDEAYVYDEKVTSTGVFKKQRTRWMEAQVGQIRHYVKHDLKGKRYSKQYFHTVIQIFLLPRSLYLLLSILVLLLIIGQYLLKVAILFPAGWYWLGVILLYWSTLLISIPSKFYSLQTLKAAFHLPLMMIAMVSALFKIKKHRKEFLHTSKTYISEE